MSIGDWRDIAVILLSLEAFLIGLVYGLIFYFLWKGSRRATKWLRWQGFPKGHYYSQRIKELTKRYSQKIVRPVVKIETSLTKTSRTLGTITKIPKKRTWRF